MCAHRVARWQEGAHQDKCRLKQLWRGLEALHARCLHDKAAEAGRKVARHALSRRVMWRWRAWQREASVHVERHRQAMECASAFHRAGRICCALQAWRRPTRQRARVEMLVSVGGYVDFRQRCARALRAWRSEVVRTQREVLMARKMLVSVGGYVDFRRRCARALHVWRSEVVRTQREVHAAVSQLGCRWAEKRWGPALMALGKAATTPS